MEQIRSGEIVFDAMKKKQEEKRKLKKLTKEQKLLTQDRNIVSTLFSILICHDQQASYLCIIHASDKKFG